MKLAVLLLASYFLAITGCCSNALIDCGRDSVPRESEVSPGTPDDTVPSGNDRESTGVPTSEENDSGDNGNEEEFTADGTPSETPIEEPITTVSDPVISVPQPTVVEITNSCTPWETWEGINAGDICGCAVDFDGRFDIMIVVGFTENGVPICGLYS